MNRKPDTQSFERDRAATEARIRDAARAVFAEKGFDAAGLREIAERAHANLSLISRYFGGKEGLLVSLTEHFVAERREGVLHYPPQETLEQEIYHYLHDKLRADLRDEAMIRVIISRSAIDAGYRARVMHNLDGLADSNFRARIATLQENGQLSEGVDVNLLFAAVMHFSFSANFFGAMIGGRPAAEIDLLFRAVAAALAQGAPVAQV